MSSVEMVSERSGTGSVTVAHVPFWRRSNVEANIAFWALVAPMVIGLGIFVFWPIVWGLLLSFSDARNSITVGNWVGWQNYSGILRDSAFQKSLITIVIFTAFIVPLTFAISLFLAVLVHTATFGRPFFRTVFFIPTAISYVIASLVWRMGIFNGLPYGFANMVLFWFGSDKVLDWIGTAHPPYYWLVLVTCRLWLQAGFYMILFLAGLQEIDQTLYEAAWVDGARPGWTTFRTITLPLLRNTSVAVILLNFIAAFQAFDEFYNILGGTQASSGNIALARPPLVYLYQVAMTQGDYGRGSAGAFILVAGIIIFTIVQGRVFGFGKRA